MILCFSKIRSNNENHSEMLSSILQEEQVLESKSFLDQPYQFIGSNSFFTESPSSLEPEPNVEEVAVLQLSSQQSQDSFNSKPIKIVNSDIFEPLENTIETQIPQQIQPTQQQGDKVSPLSSNYESSGNKGTKQTSNFSQIRSYATILSEGLSKVKNVFKQKSKEDSSSSDMCKLCAF